LSLNPQPYTVIRTRRCLRLVTRTDHLFEIASAVHFGQALGADVAYRSDKVII
jgi:hypothetical protein